MKITLTSAQANALRYAAEYKLEQEEDGDGIRKKQDRQTMLRAVKVLCDAFGWEPRYQE